MLFQYEPGNSLFHRWDPLSKLAVLMCTAVIAMIWQGAAMQGVLLVLCVLAARQGARISWVRIFRGMKIILAVAVPYFVLTALTVHGHTLWLEWGPFKLTLEALDKAGEMSLRMISLLLSSLAYIATTDPQDLVEGFVRRLRIPYQFAFGISAALTFLPLLEEEGQSIRSAKQVRGHRPPKGIAARLSWWGKFIAAVLLNSLRRVQQTAGAMESKGFGAYPDRTFRRSPQVPWWGPSLAVIAVLFTLASAWLA